MELINDKISSMVYNSNTQSRSLFRELDSSFRKAVNSPVEFKKDKELNSLENKNVRLTYLIFRSKIRIATDLKITTEAVMYLERIELTMNFTLNNYNEDESESYDGSSPNSNIILKKVKVNGFSWPYHPFQIISWIAFIIGDVVYFAIIFPILLPLWSVLFIILSCIYFILTISIIVFALKAMKWNPTDNNVLLTRKQLSCGQFPEQGDFKYFCEICNSYVSEKSKHWGDCNKCVESFDHHCKWLNSCKISLIEF